MTFKHFGRLSDVAINFYQDHAGFVLPLPLADRSYPYGIVHGYEKVPAGGHLRSPLVATKVPIPVATRSPHPSLNHPPEVPLGR